MGNHHTAGTEFIRRNTQDAEVHALTSPFD